MRKLQGSQIFFGFSGLGVLVAITGIVLLFTPLSTYGGAVLPIGIVMCVGCLIGTGGTASNGGRLEQLQFDVHVELAGESGVPVKRIVGVVGDAGFVHTHLNKGQTLRIRHHTTDPDDLYDARYDATGQAIADLKRRG